MKPLITLPCLLAAACLVGCVPPQGYHRAPGSLVTVPDDPCMASVVNSERSLSWINSSVGKPRGLSQTVVFMSGTKDAASSDLGLFNLSGTGTAWEHRAAFACYATAHFQDGTTQDGIIHVTTRQDFQFHFVHIEDTPALMRRLAAITSRRRKALFSLLARISPCRWSGCLERPSSRRGYRMMLAGVSVKSITRRPLPIAKHCNRAPSSGRLPSRRER